MKERTINILRCPIISWYFVHLIEAKLWHKPLNACKWSARGSWVPSLGKLIVGWDETLTLGNCVHMPPWVSPKPGERSLSRWRDQGPLPRRWQWSIVVAICYVYATWGKRWLVLVYQSTWCSVKGDFKLWRSRLCRDVEINWVLY